MKYHHRITTLVASLLVAVSVQAQSPDPSVKRIEKNPAASPVPPEKVVIVTGARFTYPLVQKWIDDYNNQNPTVQIIIESRGSNDPLKYDVLVEAYEQDDAVKAERQYAYVGRYAILPVATSRSVFAKIYGDKGLNADLINQIFFHDIFADKEKQKVIKAPYTVYTRLQKAGPAMTFASHFGFTQKDIKATGIAGADVHLLKALLRDSTGVSYLPLSVIYDGQSRKPIDGLTVLPIDFNGNGKVADNEKFYDTADKVIEQLETTPAGEIKNVPIAYIHLSVAKKNASPEALSFLKWVVEHGQNDLHSFGFLKPEADRNKKEIQ